MKKRLYGVFSITELFALYDQLKLKAGEVLANGDELRCRQLLGTADMVWGEILIRDVAA